MSYEKQTWATGDVITADKMNHMEDGISNNNSNNNIYTINMLEEGSTVWSDKTWNEINTAFCEGKTCILVWEHQEGGIARGIIAGVSTMPSGESDMTYSATVVFNYAENWYTRVSGDPDSPIFYSFD